MVLAVSLGAGCAATNSSADGSGNGGSTGNGGSGAGGSSGLGGSNATDCSPPCQTDQICVGTGTEGGAVIMPNDAGVCPAGSHVTDPGGGVAFCQRDLAYACAPMPSSCNGTLACACATATCPSGPYSCQVAGPRELLCVELVP
jgi:hypothetical protein